MHKMNSAELNKSAMLSPRIDPIHGSLLMETIDTLDLSPAGR